VKRITRRRLGAVIAAFAALAVVAALMVPMASASVSWTLNTQASYQGDNLWVNGEPMMTLSGDGTTLTQVFTSDYNLSSPHWPPYNCTPSKTGFNSGTWVSQSTDGGTTWSPRVRTSPATRYADRSTLAQDGSNLYLIYVTQKCYGENGTGSGPRQMFVRVSTDGGATWGTAKALTPKTGRVDYPWIAAANGVVLVAYTDANTGNVYVIRTTDGFSTMKKTKLGTTTATYSYYGPEGLYGFPSIGFDGTLGAITWTASNKGKIVTRTTTNGGASWAAVKTLATSGGNANGSASEGAAVSGRVGVTWTSKTGVYYQEFNGTWSAKWKAYTVAAPYVGVSWAAPGLFGSGQVGLAFSACKVAGCNINSKANSDMVWVESTDGGANWSSPTVLSQQPLSYNVNTYANVIWKDATTRYVIWNSIKGNYGAYGLQMSTGVG
jgi:hypothetical protein